MDYPESLSKLEEFCNTEEACREYLNRIRWSNGFECFHCGGIKFWKMADGMYRCAACKRRISITSGTIFDRSKISLVLWFRAIWWVLSQKNGASAKNLERVLSLGSYKTAWVILHKMRRAMIRPGRDRLSGTIQVDESYVGGKKSGKRGRGASGKSLVFIAAQLDNKKIGRIRLKVIKDASSESLHKAIEQNILPGSIIQTDAWRGYNNSNNYKREIIQNSEEIGKNLLPKCHRVASLLKRWIMGTHQGAISHEHLEYYLDEFTFRFNRRTSKKRGQLFRRFLEQAMITKPTIFKNIIKNVKNNRKIKNTICSG